MVTLGQLAELVAGKLSGPADLVIEGAASMVDAGPAHITFARSKKYLDQLATCRAAAIVVDRNVEIESRPLIQVDDVAQAFQIIAQYFCPPIERKRIGIHKNANVAETAIIGNNVNIWPGAFVGDYAVIGDNTTLMANCCVYEHCTIGSDTVIHSNAVVYERSIVGNRVIIHACAVIGANGFGYDSSAAGHQPGHQLGYVIVEDDVEVGASTSIDRASVGSTVIGAGTKLDNQVQIGHNCKIGKHNLFCAHVGIGGSCRTGDFVIMGGQVGIADHIEIGDRAVLGAKTGVMHSIASDETMLGAPAQPIKKQMQIWAATSKLPELRKQIKRLESSMQKLEALSGGQAIENKSEKAA
jgi:UDP-3-O-[3-hydroxymyristoyl] glucosamine N-acyltransferase